MTNTKRVLAAAVVAGVTAFSSFSAEAFFGPFSWMSGGWGPGCWGGGPWYGWGYPYYGWGYPYRGYPAVAASVVATQPATNTEK